jgi:hypothetical protein
LNVGESGLSGSTVTLTGIDQLGNSVSQSATTGAGGAFSFGNLEPSNAAGYTITQTVEPAGTLQGKTNAAGSLGGTPGSDIFSAIAVSAGQNGRNYNFGELAPVSVSGTVFVDSNRNGSLDPGEAGLGGVVVTLRNSKGNVVATSTTAQGNYDFANLPPGNYTLIETLPQGYGQSTPTSIVATVPVGGLTQQNFGLTTSLLAGFVYLDSNHNGAKDPGEPGIFGAIVSLTGTDAAGHAVSRQTTTGPDGSYVFTGLLAGTYTLSETDPPGFIHGQDSTDAPGANVSTRILSQIVVNPGSVGFVKNDFAVFTTSAGQGFASSVVASSVQDPMVLPTVISKLELLSSSADLMTDVAFVNHLFQSLLGRSPDIDGLNSLTMMLMAGFPREQITREIWQSPEHRGLEVDQYYQTYLHRLPDPAGRAGWVNSFLAGASEISVAQLFLTSAEYVATHQSNFSFVTGLYVDVLGRAPDAAGLAAAQAALQSGVNRAALAGTFLTSTEVDRDLVDRYYAQFLGRNADASGEQAFVALLQNQTLSPEAVGEIFLDSGEYYSKK